ncbi:hypothetical protein COBT_004268, partial [Conglomerata obtusa]
MTFLDGQLKHGYFEDVNPILFANPPTDIKQEFRLIRHKLSTPKLYTADEGKELYDREHLMRLSVNDEKNKKTVDLQPFYDFLKHLKSCLAKEEKKENVDENVEDVCKSVNKVVNNQNENLNKFDKISVDVNKSTNKVSSDKNVSRNLV